MRVRGLAGSLIEEKPAKVTIDEKRAREIAEDSGELRPKRIPLKKIERKSANTEAKEEGWSFGGLIRTLIIVIIIGALIYILGTQVNGVMKGMEK